MPPSTSPPPGSLLERLARCRARAVAAGALQPIATHCEVVEDGGLTFAVRVLSSLARKTEALYQERRDSGAPRVNPFLPYDEALLVGDVGPAHVCLLNKFNVVDDHLLVVTRHFEDQESPLTPADFAAVWLPLWEAGGLAFYNSGAVAGASQPHKHLQLVLGPLGPPGAPIPIAPACEAAARNGQSALPELPFAHGFRSLAPAASAAAAAAASHGAYTGLLDELDLVRQDGAPDPHNLLLTRTWMLVVPRQRECFHTVSVNALGFAGALLVRDAEELRLVTGCGPLEVLGHVVRPSATRPRSD